jgi:hypothetical protein
MDRKNAACFLANGTRANISFDTLEIIPDIAPKTSEIRHAKTASMPFYQWPSFISSCLP